MAGHALFPPHLANISVHPESLCAKGSGKSGGQAQHLGEGGGGEVGKEVKCRAKWEKLSGRNLRLLGFKDPPKKLPGKEGNRLGMNEEKQ